VVGDGMLATVVYVKQGDIRVREIRSHGLEGGGTGATGSSYPYPCGVNTAHYDANDPLITIGSRDFDHCPNVLEGGVAAALVAR
jgi:hypothetical protein